MHGPLLPDAAPRSRGPGAAPCLRQRRRDAAPAAEYPPLVQETSALAAGISKAEHVATSLGSRLALTEQRANELQAGKQDAVTAVTMDMVNARVANVRLAAP